MLKALEKKGVKVAKIKIKESKTQSIENQLQNLAFQEPEIKYLGQRVCPFSNASSDAIADDIIFTGFRFVHALRLLA